MTKREKGLIAIIVVLTVALFIKSTSALTFNGLDFKSVKSASNSAQTVSKYLSKNKIQTIGQVLPADTANWYIEKANDNSLRTYYGNSNINSSAITITSENTVGIGTNNPGAKLELSDSSGPAMRFNRPGTGSTDLVWDGNRFAIINGDVGIGTNNPTAKLEVNGDIKEKDGYTVTTQGHWHNGNNYSNGANLKNYHITAALTNSSGYTDITLPFYCTETWMINVLATPYSNSPFSTAYRALGWGVNRNTVRLYVVDSTGVNGIPNQYVSAEVFCP